MATYDLYGSLSKDIHAAKHILELALGIKFEGRDSWYQGGGYFQWGSAGGEHFVLKRNSDPIDDVPSEMSFPAYKILLYLNDTVRSTELQEIICQGDTSFVALRHENLD